jgi:adenylate kinase
MWVVVLLIVVVVALTVVLMMMQIVRLVLLMRMVLMGPPGAGKGTQAALVAERLGVPHISTGEIFRANVSERTPLGIEAQQFMDAGEYVPDSVTNAMVRNRLESDDASGGFLLDGYPRTVDQVSELNSMLAERGVGLDQAVEIVVDIDEVVGRLIERSRLQGRADDTEDVVRRRLEVYTEQTAPLTALYAQQGILVAIDGMGSINDVTQRFLDAISV